MIQRRLCVMCACTVRRYQLSLLPRHICIIKLTLVISAGWMKSGDQSCIECDENGVAWFKVVALVVAMLMVIAAVASAYSCYQMLAARGAKREAGELRWVKPNFVSGGAVWRYIST